MPAFFKFSVDMCTKAGLSFSVWKAMRKIRFFVLLFRKVEEHGSVDSLNNGFISILTFSCPFFSNFAATNRSIERTTGYQIAARGKTVKMGGRQNGRETPETSCPFCHEIKSQHAGWDIDVKALHTAPFDFPFLSITMYPDTAKNGIRRSVRLDYHMTAFKIVIDIVGDKACLEFPRIADRICRAGDIQTFWEDKFNASDSYILAGAPCVGRDQHSFHTALVFTTLAVHLGQNGGQSNPLVGTDILQGNA